MSWGFGRGRTDGGRISFEEFTAAVTNSRYPEPSHVTYWTFLNEARNITLFDKEELAMVLAHFIHDSDGFVRRREKIDVENYPDSYKDPTCDAPGKFYYGRGYLKIKMCKKYQNISMDIYDDDRLVQHPETLVEDEETAIKAGLAFWNREVRGFPGVDEGHFGATTNAISGSSECSGENTIVAARRYEIYKNVRKAFNLAENPDAEQGCYEIKEFNKATR